MQRLSGVTLLAVTSIDIDRTHSALVRSADQMEFGAVKMLSSSSPTKPDSRVQYVSIPPIDFIGYSRFMIEKLNDHVDTEHCLVVQADGFILDGARWRDEFLDHDYIGAPWPEYLAFNGDGSGVLQMEKNRVGNGGFSLRSKKLLRAIAGLQFDRLPYPLKSEDILICHYLYDDMRALDISFAPVELAALFSIESTRQLYGQSFETVFGFHGKHWLDRALGAVDGEAFRTARRNELCPCGSGRRFKHCHGQIA
jgi:hypothetical protein